MRPMRREMEPALRVPRAPAVAVALTDTSFTLILSTGGRELRSGSRPCSLGGVVPSQQLRCADRAAYDTEVEGAEVVVQQVAELPPQRRVHEALEAVAVPGDVGGVQQDVGVAEDPKPTKITAPSRPRG